MNGERRLPHEPALDGLRGLGVAGVVLFHAGYSWAIGGFLGVSTFFTLSGFLITSLLLAEQERSGRIDLRAFWARRARRLLPAAMLTLLGVSVLASALATPEQLASLRGDVLAALCYVANWRFILAGQSYADLFAAPSPVLHFWSLAVEEQLYVAFPIVVALVGRRRLVPTLVALIAGSVALSFVLVEGGGRVDAAYYGTGVRAGELLVGALLAVLVTRAPQIRAAGVTRALGVGALGALLWLWSTTRQDASWLYHGGFVAHGVLSALVILACVRPGPVRAVLSIAPLRALGRISYGVYLYHWPVFVWYHGPLLLQLALTLTLAITSFFVVEQPIRERRWRVPLAAVPAGMVLVAATVAASTMNPPTPTSFDVAAPATLPDNPVQPTPDAPVVAIFGDSTALRTGFALKGYGWTTGRIDVRDGGADIGCPLLRGGVVDFVSRRAEPDPSCEQWPTRWTSLARDDGLDAAVVQIGPWDVSDHRIDGHWTHIGDPAYDARLKKEIELAVDSLSSTGAKVVWLTAPHIDFGRGQTGLPKTSIAHISDRARIDRLNALIRDVAAERPNMVVVDLAAHLSSLPGGEMDPALRPDGVHFTEKASGALAAWLTDAIRSAVARS